MWVPWRGPAHVVAVAAVPRRSQGCLPRNMGPLLALLLLTQQTRLGVYGVVGKGKQVPRLWCSPHEMVDAWYCKLQVKAQLWPCHHSNGSWLVQHAASAVVAVRHVT